MIPWNDIIGAVLILVFIIFPLLVWDDAANTRGEKR